jgi:hypothetical protein
MMSCLAASSALVVDSPKTVMLYWLPLLVERFLSHVVQHLI